MARGLLHNASSATVRERERKREKKKRSIQCAPNNTTYEIVAHQQHRHQHQQRPTTMTSISVCSALFCHKISKYIYSRERSFAISICAPSEKMWRQALHQSKHIVCYIVCWFLLLLLPFFFLFFALPSNGTEKNALQFDFFSIVHGFCSDFCVLFFLSLCILLSVHSDPLELDHLKWCAVAVKRVNKSMEPMKTTEKSRKRWKKGGKRNGKTARKVRQIQNQVETSKNEREKTTIKFGSKNRNWIRDEKILSFTH